MKIHLCPFFYGGVDQATASSLILELAERREGVEIDLDPVGDDALISRSRSLAATRFLDGDADVFFMLDHDIRFDPGAIAATCAKALAADAVVGGLYSCRGIRAGLASRFLSEQVQWRSGSDQLHEAEYVAGGFVAIPRRIVEAVVDRLRRDDVDTDLRVRRCLIRSDGMYMWDLFRPAVVASTMHDGAAEYLSEDWAFCHRVRHCGEKLWLWSWPRLEHVGRYSYVLDQAQ